MDLSVRESKTTSTHISSKVNRQHRLKVKDHLLKKKVEHRKASSREREAPVALSLRIGQPQHLESKVKIQSDANHGTLAHGLSLPVRAKLPPVTT